MSSDDIPLGNAVATEDGWTVEMFLPWSMMSMPEAPDGNRRMGFSVSRELGELHERWSWPALPFTQPKFLFTMAEKKPAGIKFAVAAGIKQKRCAQAAIVRTLTFF